MGLRDSRTIFAVYRNNTIFLVNTLPPAFENILILAGIEQIVAYIGIAGCFAGIVATWTLLKKSVGDHEKSLGNIKLFNAAARTHDLTIGIGHGQNRTIEFITQATCN